MTTADGFKYTVNAGIGANFSSKSEGMVCKFLESVASKGKVFVDIGAFVGTYSIRLADLYGEVIAIEPDVYNLEVLKANIDLNHITNMRVLDIGIGNESCQKDFLSKSCGGIILREKSADQWKAEGATVVKVSIEPLDDVVGEANVIKIDTEGYEELVLLGASKLLDSRPCVVIEHHDKLYPNQFVGSTERISDIFSKRDYLGLWLDSGHRAYIPIELDLRLIKDSLVFYWINHTLENIKNRKGWFNDIPYRWWYGMNEVSFYSELPGHILKNDEKEWLRGLEVL